MTALIDPSILLAIWLVICFGAMVFVVTKLVCNWLAPKYLRRASNRYAKEVRALGADEADIEEFLNRFQSNG